MALVRSYRALISPLLGANKCRFTPTCSEYALAAVERYGSLKGIFLAIWRILRCHPFSKGGYDPVPYPKNHQ
jgi:putative membrane protein insertion efficiency factor